MAQSTFVQHEPCPHCRERGGDKDGNNLARYSDGHGYCFVCDYWEDSKGVASRSEYKEDVEDADIELKNFIEPTIKPLTKRKLTTETCQKFGYGTAEYLGSPAQIATYRSCKDNGCTIVAQHIRMPDKEFRWVGDTKNLQLFGQHLWREGGKRVTITEGEIDCLTISQLQDNKFPVVSLPNGVSSAEKYIKQNLEWLETFEKVILAFDMDEPGRKAVAKVAPLFSAGKAHIAELPEKDPNDCLIKGKQRELINALWEARPYRPDGIRSGFDLWDEILKPPPTGYSISYPELSEKLHGLRLGELYLFTAGSGIGKSTLVNEIAYELKMTYDLPLGIMALEESPARNARRYLGIHLNKPLHLPEVQKEVEEKELRCAFDEVMGDGKWFIYDHFGSSDIDTLLSKLRYMAVGLGCKVIVLDHISIVVSGLEEAGAESERKTIDLLMTKLRQLIEETGIMVLAVVHLKRPDKGKSYNEGRQVSLTDLRGSGSLEQIADAVIALERDQQGEDPNTAYIRVLKNRMTGDVGQAGAVRYYKDTGRLLSIEEGEDVDGVDYGFEAETNNINDF